MEITQQTVQINQALRLESGRVLNRYAIAYETYGQLNAVGDNAVLVCHGYTANQHAAGCEHEGSAMPGWWDAAIGPGKPIDTDRYFVLSSNVLGGAGGSSSAASIDLQSGKPYGMRFPVITIGDMVEAQCQLASHLGIARFHAVIGGCMGGFQVMEWMARFPSRLERGMIIGATHRVSAHTIALMSIIREAIRADPDWQGGDYYGSGKPNRGMGLATTFGICIWMGRSVMEQRFANRVSGDGHLQYGFGAEFEVERFLQQVGSGSSERIDPNALIYLGRAMQYFDLTRRYRQLSDAFAGFRGKALLVSYDSDWRYPPGEMDLTHQALLAAGVASRHITLSSDFGHGAFIYDFASLAPVLTDFVNLS